ncbi:hypothetical protein G5C51_30935 [Streptomyces sp. A7024]|uniref:Lipoprotein n=1 Tax=Streptomyces coryli TaxID=1128680 RepID=A0A6G4UAT2_9ACTN|nr:hypothetical protein [Streptomyces coryli]NGN68301.1 hypothetical protein [Streptomyces coryli]
MTAWRTSGALLALAVVVAGCGGGGGDKDGVASAGDGKGGASASPSMDKGEMAMAFAKCLRKHGLDVKDPKVGKGVELNINAGPGSGLTKKEVDKAMAACRKYDPGVQGGNRKPDPKVEAKMRKYSQCMRKNGVEDFPDPDGNGLRLDGKIMEDPDFKSAEKKCDHLQGKGGSLKSEKG